METKPGIYTTEFWVHNAIQLLLWLNTSGAWNYAPGLWGHRLSMAGSVVLAALYAWSRGKAKEGVAADPALPANRKLVPRKKDMHHR